MTAIEGGVEHALDCWQRGFNCAESVMRGACRAERIDLSPQTLKVATPFGGGVGRSEDICGALTGGVLAIGVVLGRTEPTEDKLKSYDAAKELHDWFEKRFGSTLCMVLNRGDFKSPEHKKRCTRFVEEAAREACLIMERRKS